MNKSLDVSILVFRQLCLKMEENVSFHHFSALDSDKFISAARLKQPRLIKVLYRGNKLNEKKKTKSTKISRDK